MKTPIQVSIETIEGLLEIDFKSNEYSDGYRKCIKDIAKYLKSQMLEKEKEVMCEFALKYAQADRKEPCETSTQLVFDETFNTKEK